MKRKLSLLLALVMILSLVPMSAFAAGGSATYSRVTGLQSVKKGETVTGTLGRIKVTVPAGAFTDTYDEFLFKVDGVESAVITAVYASGDNSLVSNPTLHNPSTDGTEVRIRVTPSAALANAEDAVFYVVVSNVEADKSSDDIVAKFTAKSNSVFPAQNVTLATKTKGSAEVSISNKTITDSETTLKALKIKEDIAGALANGELKIKLPKGFYWDVADNLSYPVTNKWGDVNDVRITNVDRIDSNYQSIIIKFPAHTQASSFEIKDLKVKVDPVLAKMGDIKAKLSVESGGFTITPSDLVLATYGDYTVSVKAFEDPEVLFAGKYDQELTRLQITEGIAKTIRPGRTLTFTLPQGVKWVNVGDIAIDDDESEDYDELFGGISFSIVDTEKRVVRAILNNLEDDAATAVFEGLKVVVAPSFTGDLEVAVGGTAGIEGKVVLAKVISPVKAEVTKLVDLKVGVQDQLIEDIIITENLEGAMERGKTLVIEAPSGVRFSTTPTATVVEGDALIEKVWADPDGKEVYISVVADSDEVTKLKVSGLKITLDRYVSEGSLKLNLKGASIVDPEVHSDTLNYFVGATVSTTVQVGNVITPADGNTKRNVTFTIDSKDYVVNGVTMTADIAPYIKDSRTFLSVRYAAEALGVSSNAIVWNQDAQTVTVYKGTNIAVVTVGSNVLTVNGTQIQMDTVVENVNGRVTLPIAHLALALGVDYEWDGAARTVTFK